jgi:hypothetical protein
VIYLSGCMAPTRHPRLGFLMTPDRGDVIPADEVLVAADSGCYANPENYTDERYLAKLDRMPRERTLFATAPDVLGDHAATIERAVPMLRVIRALGLKAAFVAQDGWSETNTPWEEFDAMFIGGSTEFKFRGGREAVFAAHLRGKWAHMGRVNSLGRLRAAVGIGCNSADGNFLRFAPKENWQRMCRWFDAIDRQRELAV